MRVLYDLVHARATQSWHESINKDNFSRWAEHWVGTARELVQEFRNERLDETANALDAIAEQQERFI